MFGMNLRDRYPAEAAGILSANAPRYRQMALPGVLEPPAPRTSGNRISWIVEMKGHAVVSLRVEAGTPR